MRRPLVTCPRPLGRRGGRVGLRGAVLTLPLLLTLALPAVASAAATDDLPGRAATFSVIDGILIFGVAPVGVFLLVALIVMRPGTAPKAQRYRPGRDWTAAPSWSGLQPGTAPHADRPALGVGHQPMPVMGGAADAGAAESSGSGPVPGDLSDTPRIDQPGDPISGSGGARGSW